eukprot:ANDGO_07371.mRNA.1 Protein Mo25
MFVRRKKTPAEVCNRLCSALSTLVVVSNFESTTTTVVHTMSSDAGDSKIVRKAQEDLVKYLGLFKGLLTEDPDALGEALMHGCTLVLLCKCMVRLSFEARKDIVQAFSLVAKRNPSKVADPEILELLLLGYRVPEIALNCGLMLREALRLDSVARLFFASIKTTPSPITTACAPLFEETRVLIYGQASKNIQLASLSSSNSGSGSSSSTNSTPTLSHSHSLLLSHSLSGTSMDSPSVLATLVTSSSQSADLSSIPSSNSLMSLSSQLSATNLFASTPTSSSSSPTPSAPFSSTGSSASLSTIVLTAPLDPEAGRIELFFPYLDSSNFDVQSDALATFKEALTKHKAPAAEYMLSRFETFFTRYNALLSSENYVTRRQSLKLLGELLLDRTNFKVMTKYIAVPDHLKRMMTLLKDKSRNIQFEAFHVFKIFVANPNKPPEIKAILWKNQTRLVAFLEGFLVEKEDDQFRDEKGLLIKEIKTLAPENIGIPGLLGAAASSTPGPAVKPQSEEAVESGSSSI